MNKIVDHRVDNGMSLEEYETFFQPVINTKAIKTKSGCPVNQRCNIDADGVTTPSVTQKFEDYSNKIVGLDKKNETNLSAREAQHYRTARTKNVR